jgi:hypothetical protein
LTEDDVLFGVEQPAEVGGATGLFNATTALQQARLDMALANIEGRKLRTQKESGSLIPRTEVAASGFEAGKVAAMILQNLPSEIASIFADPNQKDEVRAKVQQRVDQMQHAIHSALVSLGVASE